MKENCEVNSRSSKDDRRSGDDVTKSNSKKKHSSHKSSKHKSKDDRSKNSRDSSPVKCQHCHCHQKPEKDEPKKSEEKHSKRKERSSENKSKDSSKRKADSSFENALAMCEIPLVPKKKKTKSGHDSSKKKEVVQDTTFVPAQKSLPKNTKSSSHSPALLAPHTRLKPLNINMELELEDINADYSASGSGVEPDRRQKQDAKDLTEFMVSKTRKTKVYSGSKSESLSAPVHQGLCMPEMIKKINEHKRSKLPVSELRSTVERATPEQLVRLENYEPNLLDITGPLWEIHCKREFRRESREEMETWREMYTRCTEDRDYRLQMLKEKFKSAKDKGPSKIAFVDNIRAPQHIRKKQIKYGTGHTTSSSDLKKISIVYNHSRGIVINDHEEQNTSPTKEEEKPSGSGRTRCKSTDSPSPSPSPVTRPAKIVFKRKRTPPMMAKVLNMLKTPYKLERMRYKY